MITLPADYEERVYAGVLGKIIGVYLGRPFEQWPHEKIERELGEVWYYVHEKLGKPLIVSDDDISGTFTFLRALADHDTGHHLTSAQVGKTWLNYLVEKRTVLWWGGMGISTEHTAYLRLKQGIPAPRSGSADLNGELVAHQIGAQIFIDGWAMVCPGDPEKAVALAGKAARVSHDGEAVYAAQVVAAMEALAFVESDRHTLLAAAATFIPRASLVYALIEDVRAWHEAEPHHWRAGLAKIQNKWGYDKYGGGCHVLPNHALVLLALLWGDDDFQKSQMIANTAGWDTDCNAGNIGCLMGIKNGLAGLEKGADFRGPVADRMYLPTADGGRCITDAVRETYEIVNLGRALQGLRPLAPNHGMRFHFNLPGGVQGFAADEQPETRGTVRVENVTADSRRVEGAADDERVLALHYAGVAPGRVARVSTPTFLPPDALGSSGYETLASPTLYAGQKVRARLIADKDNARAAPVRLYVRVYGEGNRLEILHSPLLLLAPGESSHFHWDVPDTDGRPIALVGIEVGGQAGSGTVYLDWMGWGGAPHVTLGRPEKGGELWKRAWVNAAEEWKAESGAGGLVYGLVQNEGRGLVTQGEASWTDYTVSARVNVRLADAAGLMACVQGLRRFVAVIWTPDDMVRLVERHDDRETVLDEAPCPWELWQTRTMTLTTRRDGSVNAFIARDDDAVTLSGQIALRCACGAVGLLVSDGYAQFGPVQVAPAPEVAAALAAMTVE